MSQNDSVTLEEQVGELRLQVRRMEEALVRHGIVLQEPPTRPAPVVVREAQPSAAPLAWTTAMDRQTEAARANAQEATPQAGLRQPFAGASFGGYQTVAAKDERSLENRIGSQWFNRVGILAVLIAVAWFLKLAVDNHWIGQWIGPSGRVLIGLGAGAGIIAWSERLRGRGYAIFSYSLKAVGSGTLYLSLWAAFSLYQLIPPPLAFVAMILVTAFNGYMAWAQDAELLGLYAIAGALSTPLLVSTGENHEVTLMSYLLVLTAAVLGLVALRPWSRLLFGTYVGMMLLFGGWWAEYYSNDQFAPTAFFLTIFFLIFAFAPRLVRVDLEDGKPHSGWDNLALVVLPLSNAALAFLAYYLLFDHFHSDWTGAWLAVGFAAFYLFLLRLPAMGRLQAAPRLLGSLHLTTAVVFLTIAIPFKAQGRWLTIGWLAEGAALLWLASRQRLALLRVLALFCLALGLGALLMVNPEAATTPILNARFASYCAAIAAFVFVGWVAQKAKEQSEWRAIAGGAVLAVNALILLAVGLEIHSYWWGEHWSGDGTQYDLFQMYAQFTYSVWFMLFGAILLAVGFWRRTAFLRWQALVLLAVTIIKVFLYDMSELSQGYRILSFLGLGALLFAVSFVYQRDWLKLRAAKGESNEN